LESSFERANATSYARLYEQNHIQKLKANQQEEIARRQREKVAAEALSRKNQELSDLKSKIENRIAPLAALLHSVRSESIAFVSSSEELDFNDLDALIQNGVVIEAKIAQAESVLGEIESGVRSLRASGATIEAPKADHEVLSKFKRRLDRLRRLSRLQTECAVVLKNSKIPNHVIYTRVCDGERDETYLFEILCVPIHQGVNVSYREASWDSNGHDITFNRTTTLSFMQRDVDGNRLLAPKKDGQTTSKTRLILKRVSSGMGSTEANELWQSIGLLNTAAMLLSMMGPSLDE
jgi:hypothetical protein